MPTPALKVFTQEQIFSACRGPTHLYADVSVTTGSSAIGVQIPSVHRIVKEKLSPKTPSTATELAPLRTALHFISRHHTRLWQIFLDLQVALKALRKLSNHRSQLVCKINEIHTTAVHAGHRVVLQWLPDYCGT